MKEDNNDRNLFVAALKEFKVYTQNGALSNATSGSLLVDYFAKSGTYRDRKQEEVDADIAKIWTDSPLIALRIIFYNRTISRSTKGFFVSETVQKGQGSRDEFRKALTWLSKNKPDTLYANLWLIPLVGCWKDLWHIDTIKVLDHTKVYDLMKRGIADEYNCGLIAKYLPRIRSKKKVTTERHKLLNEFARGFCKYMKWTEKEYRKFKANKEYSAHEFQRQMCAGFWDQIDFNRIPGKALFNLISRKGKDKQNALARHGQEQRYTAWLSKKPVAKFTGYVYELFTACKGKTSPIEKMTYNKQFDGIIELAKKDEGGIKGNVWCALDTSGSMGTVVIAQKKVSAYDICISLGIYFAELNEGAFHNHVIMFDAKSYSKALTGTFTDKVEQIKREKTAWGCTNFQSVIDHIVELRKTRPQIPVSDFPETLIVVSDMQFNPVGGNTQTNYQAAMAKLAAVGLPKMKIIWWFVTGKADVPSTIEDEGVTMIGGFDGAVVTNLLGGQTTVVDKETGKVRQLNAMENMLKALNQEILLQLKVADSECPKDEKK
eukprot:TRINITY_DN4565_c0_g1_i2.p1 TRINITY_DN4565_c0_g1~~TRINITY_DN4565_c0_g1_i2.p1  ORF type:complete len:546 (-),score=114.39 TRINITY_DN4565_c0_g1_i2:91-1728(-)